MKITVFNVSLYTFYQQMQLILSVHYAQPQSLTVIFAMFLPIAFNVLLVFSYQQVKINVDFVLNTLKIVFIVKINQHVFYVILSILLKVENVKNVHHIYKDATHVQIQHIVQHVKMVMYTMLIQQHVRY